MATVARLEAILTANTAQFERAMTTSETRMQGVRKTAGIAGAAIVGGLAYGLEKSVHAALDAQVSQTRLDQAFKRSGISALRYAKQVDVLESSGRKLGFTDTQTKDALGSLLIATHSMTLASKDLSVAQDIARFKHVDLTAATKMLAMAMAGSQRATKQLGIDVPHVTSTYDALKATVGKTIDASEKLALAQAKLTDKHKTAALVIETVRQKLGGQAAAYSQTAAGGMEQFRAQLDHLEVSLGKGLLPILASVAAAMAAGTDYFSKHATETKLLIGALAVLGTTLITVSVSTKIASAATKLWTAATKVATAAQWLFNLALDANPIGAVIVGVAALTAALVVLQVKYQGVTKAIDFLSSHLYILMAIPIIGWSLAAAGAVYKNWDRIRSVFEAITSTFRKLIHWLEVAVSTVKELVSWIGKIHVPSFHLPHIPNPFGDGGGPPGSGGAEGRAFHVGRQLWDEIGMGEHFGLRVTSGYRPGAVTKHGTKSDHSYDPSRAVDMSGAPAGMAGLFRALIGRTEVRQSFYDPLGSIFNGIWSSYREGGHSDHIHIAEYDKGGWLPPGLSLALNNTGRSERITPTGKVLAHGQGTRGAGSGSGWKQDYWKFMNRIWQFARPHFPNALSGMPPVTFTTGMDALYVGTDMTPDRSGNPPPAGRRMLFWPKWMTLVGDKNKIREDATRQTLIHEWAHEFQSKPTTASYRLSEGGADAFAYYNAPSIFAAAGIPFKPYNVFGKGNLYAGVARWVREHKGMGWIERGQFGNFDRGGWLQPGVTLAVNNTGKPERVGGGGDTVIVQIGPEEVARVVFDQIRGKARIFMRNNGRPAFGGA